MKNVPFRCLLESFIVENKTFFFSKNFRTVISKKKKKRIHYYKKNEHTYECLGTINFYVLVSNYLCGCWDKDCFISLTTRITSHRGQKRT